jgi:RNA polymerase sigma factor (sigma-70 family)
MHEPSHRTAAAALEDFLEAARPKLDRQLAALKIPVEDAEDLVHDSLVSLLDHGMDGIENPEAWLLGTLRHKGLQYWRQQRREHRLQQILSRVLAAHEQAPQERQDSIRDLAALTKHLPAREAQALWLRFGLGRKPREIAVCLRIQPDSVRTLTRRALQRIRLELAAVGHLRGLHRLALAAGVVQLASSTPSPTAPAQAAAALEPIALVLLLEPARDRRGKPRRRRAPRRSRPTAQPPAARHRP